ncbi:MAG: hypothetical protein IKT55_03190 [Clostridia bacterium]|nr:hypothetical protein [Clostridia bacterium]
MGITKNTQYPLFKILSFLLLIFSFIIVAPGCGITGDKTGSLLIIYIVTTVFSFVMLVGYFIISKKKSLWFIVLYTSIFIVNVGYLCISLSGNVTEALLANRIAYLGSVFLPYSMFMIILSVSNIKFKKLVPIVLVILSVVVLIIAASPGYSCIYYKSVELVNVNGVSILEKTYGPLHFVYLIYLVSYFASMIGVIIYSVIKRKNTSQVYPGILAFTVFINIGLWLLEQFIRTDFELLSVSYIISGMFLLALNLITKDDSAKPCDVIVSNEVNEDIIKAESEENTSETESKQVNIDLSGLTKTERKIYDYYIEGKSTKEVMAELNITENTLKYHNKNIYGKLGVSSRKQLIDISKI